jgi:ATP-dependent Lon protease
MPLEKFHNMLDFYLNHSFDLSKVMIFIKFYKKYYEDKLTNQLSKFFKQGVKPG